MKAWKWSINTTPLGMTTSEVYQVEVLMDKETFIKDGRTGGLTILSKPYKTQKNAQKALDIRLWGKK